MGVTNSTIKKIAELYTIDPAALKAFIEVETPGSGFDKKTGKILIQFEPVWFKRQSPYAPSGTWSLNKVDVQSKEWIAFNDAFSKNADAAMKSTSIGLGQIMGFHFALLGYASVGQMWEDAKKSEYHQLIQLIRFLKTYKGGQILSLLSQGNFHQVAVLYNGAEYKKVAQKYNREPYDISLGNAYLRAKKIFE